MARTAGDVLAHHGVKGMKWGVRNDKGHEGERAKTKKIAKLDKKFEKDSQSARTTVNIYNGGAKKYNTQDVERINNKPEYKDADFTRDSPLRQKYYREHQDAFLDRLTETAKEMGTNASGTKEYGISETANGGWDVYMKDVVRHADDGEKPDGFEMHVSVTYRDGRITKVSPDVEEIEHVDRSGVFLAHYGVKGMKWGVRKERSAVEVSTKTSPGRKVKASGGKFHSPSEDAIRAAKTRQQAKKSTTDSLSNKELQELITRMNLEAQYKNLNQNNVGIGKKLLRTVLGQVGDKEVGQLQEFTNSQRGMKNDPKTDFGVKVAVAGAKAVAGGGKKK